MNHVLDITGAVVGAAYVLLVPGFVLSHAFCRRGQIDVIERLALSFALSIAVVPMVVFYLNLIGVPISKLNVILEVAGITLASGAAAWLVARRKPEESKVKKGSVAVKTEPDAQTPEPPNNAPRPHPKETPKPRRRRIQF